MRVVAVGVLPSEHWDQFHGVSQLIRYNLKQKEKS